MWTVILLDDQRTETPQPQRTPPTRILFIFDPQRQAVLLAAGDKAG